ncbi:MAG: hypothetical protein LC655_01415, partial [Bacteroidales bacterium]|nr:hypothetical protein [Bacteroidales bacterium]
MPEIIFRDLGVMDYKKTWDYQEELFGKWMEYKRKVGQVVRGSQVDQDNQDNQDNQGEHGSQSDPGTPAGPGDPPGQYLLFVEHPHVYTLGKSGDETNMLIHKEFLEKIDATYYKINRGGDITYHGPGQIVGYPILDLESHNMGLKGYISFL